MSIHELKPADGARQGGDGACRLFCLRGNGRRS